LINNLGILFSFRFFAYFFLTKKRNPWCPSSLIVSNSLPERRHQAATSSRAVESLTLTSSTWPDFSSFSLALIAGVSSAHVDPKLSDRVSIVSNACAAGSADMADEWPGSAEFAIVSIVDLLSWLSGGPAWARL
jgi:hypothetical protein